MTTRGKVYSLVRPESLNGLHAIESLVHLGRLGADRLLVIWDGSPIHRRAEVKALLAEAGDAIHLEALPPYAPDLDPVEWQWRHLKEVEMRNLACGDPEELHLELHLALGRAKEAPPERILPRGSRAGPLKLYFSMQRSVTAFRSLQPQPNRVPARRNL